MGIIYLECKSSSQLNSRTLWSSSATQTSTKLARKLKIAQTKPMTTKSPYTGVFSAFLSARAETGPPAAVAEATPSTRASEASDGYPRLDDQLSLGSHHHVVDRQV